MPGGPCSRTDGTDATPSFRKTLGWRSGVTTSRRSCSFAAEHPTTAWKPEAALVAAAERETVARRRFAGPVTWKGPVRRRAAAPRSSRLSPHLQREHPCCV